jgi:tetratricopeptide (TPR) repeat protein
MVADGGELALAADAGPAVDAAATISPSEELLDQARVHLGRDAGAALAAAEKMLGEGGKADATTLGMRASLISAQAQVIEDEAELATDAKTAAKIRRDSKQLVLTALGLAQRAIKASAGDPLANIAMADVLRLQGKPMKDVRRYLDTARQASPGDREASLVEALAAVRDKDYTRAGQLLKGLDQGALEATGDVRPRWHLARVAFLQKKQADARAAADAVIAAQPEHAGARAMLARLGTVAVDPLPSEDVDAGVGGGSGSGTGSSVGPGSGSGTGPTGPVGPVGDDYDKLLAKANKLAEVDCGQAMPYYQRALEGQPNGVEALSGMGFCHIDAKQFASAHSKFRAALGISPRFERALWGVAEAYQQQGRNDLAITAYEKYLEVYPSSAPAQRQLDRLKGTGGGGPTPPENGSGGGGAGSASGAVDKPPDLPPDPTPETTPSPDPASNP